MRILPKLRQSIASMKFAALVLNACIETHLGEITFSRIEPELLGVSALIVTDSTVLSLIGRLRTYVPQTLTFSRH